MMIVSYSHFFKDFSTSLIANNLDAIALLEDYLGVTDKGLIKTKELEEILNSLSIYHQPTLMINQEPEGVVVYRVPFCHLEQDILNAQGFKFLRQVKVCASFYQQEYNQGVIPLLVNFAPREDRRLDPCSLAALGIMSPTIKLQDHCIFQD